MPEEKRKEFFTFLSDSVSSPNQRVEKICRKFSQEIHQGDVSFSATTKPRAI